LQNKINFYQDDESILGRNTVAIGKRSPPFRKKKVLGAARSSEASLSNYQSPRRHIPEAFTL